MQERTYTTACHRLYAKFFKQVNELPLGNYRLDSALLSEQHKHLKLVEFKSGERAAIFNIGGKSYQINFRLDDSSASNKLYITCPYCKNKKQHLYVITNGYACRNCLGLHYTCQSEGSQDRLARRIRLLRQKLWGSDWPEINNLLKHPTYWPKPKWIRWKTFNQKQEEIRLLEIKYWAVMIKAMHYRKRKMGIAI